MAAEVVTLLGKEGGGPMVKRRIATDTDGTVEAPMGTEATGVTMTTAQGGADDVQHHHDATNLSTGRCLARTRNVRGRDQNTPTA